MKTGDYVYYINADGEHQPGRVVGFTKKRVKVMIDHPSKKMGEKMLVLASPSKVELQ